MRHEETVRTGHQSLEVWKSREAVEFRVAGAVHAWFHQRRLLTGLAWDMIAAGALLGKLHPPRSVLMLGLAGGTSLRVLRHLLPDTKFTAIDIDPEIVALARKHMALDELGIEIRIADAYRWLATQRRTYDVVIDDIYLAGKTDVFRPQAMDETLLGHLARAVTPGGMLAVNLVTGTGHRTMQSLVRRTLGGRFPVLRSVTSPDAMNEVLVAGEDVATRGRLMECLDRFEDRDDRRYWSRIAVRKIRATER
ncbi:MAG TPA: fused MFS/spermidine synthase [Luteolibacter sp.]|nr:fused MFS/spermidine synthase [Luteolibacter sp.]